jgi:hypothetical protein
MVGVVEGWVAVGRTGAAVETASRAVGVGGADGLLGGAVGEEEAQADIRIPRAPAKSIWQRIGFARVSRSTCSFLSTPLRPTDTTRQRAHSPCCRPCTTAPDARIARAACWSRRPWTKMLRTIPSWSTARYSQHRRLLMVSATSSKNHLSPRGRGCPVVPHPLSAFRGYRFPRRHHLPRGVAVSPLRAEPP